jgi:hypothetical protein
VLTLSSALDILLYQSAYREHISNIVLAESNRIYNLFRERNPNFKGKVSLIGHSLGSAILFDILCRQKESPKIHTPAARQTHYKSQRSAPNKSKVKGLEFDFEVEDFYCLGSPIGMCHHRFFVSSARSGNKTGMFLEVLNIADE